MRETFFFLFQAFFSSFPLMKSLRLYIYNEMRLIIQHQKCQKYFSNTPILAGCTVFHLMMMNREDGTKRKKRKENPHCLLWHNSLHVTRSEIKGKRNENKDKKQLLFQTIQAKRVRRKERNENELGKGSEEKVSFFRNWQISFLLGCESMCTSKINDGKEKREVMSKYLIFFLPSYSIYVQLKQIFGT